MAKIFEKLRLTATQLKTVADRRFGDASYLRDSGQNVRANGVYYLGGFVIECLLKARLAQEYPTILSQLDPTRLSKADRVIRDLMFRSHDLDRMLQCLPDLVYRMRAAKETGGLRALTLLKQICGEWTIFARYSPRQETMANAAKFLDQIEELRRWLE